jgi:hypothetical protein
MLVAAAILTTLAFGAFLGFVFACVFCEHARRAPVALDVQPEPIIVMSSAGQPASEPTACDDMAQIFRDAGLELIGGHWAQPNAPYLKRKLLV